MNVCIIGGGGGTSNLMRILRPLVESRGIMSLTGLITISDDGGSTGILKESYKTTAFGDVGKVLMEASDPSNESLTVFNEALLFRFADGPLKGHTVRNILMTALELQCRGRTSNSSSKRSAFGQTCTLGAMKEILHIPKNINVLPISNDSCSVQLKTRKEVVLTKGQFSSSTFRIQDQYQDKNDVLVTLNGQGCGMSDAAGQALDIADIVVIAPGHTHGTILPALATEGLRETLMNFKGKIVVIVPFFNRKGIAQTVDWTATDYVEVYTEYMGTSPDYVIMQETKEKEGDIYFGQETFQCVKSTDMPVGIIGIKGKIRGGCSDGQCKSDAIVRSPATMDPEMVREIFKEKILVCTCEKCQRK